MLLTKPSPWRYGLVVVLLSATTLVAPLGASAVAAPQDSSARHAIGKIAVVPLDDRPVNMYAPAMTAKVAGFETSFPPRSELGRFTTPGDGPAVGDWLLHQQDANAYVVSVSMLAYGGLIASRTTGVSTEQANQNVQAIRKLRAQRPDAPILVFDTIQRLALTGLGGDKDYGDLVRQWAILYDQVVNLGQEQFRAQLDSVRSQIPDDVIANYLAARKRNFDINQQMVRWVADGTISHLVLGEDDTAQYGLERAERVQLEQLVTELNVPDQVQIFPGADEIDSLLVARYVLQSLGVHPRIGVEYSGVDGSDWVPPLEDISFDKNIARHVAALGGSVVSPSEPNIIHLLVNTPSAEGGDHASELDRMVSRAKALLADGQKVIVDDPLYVNRADHDLVAKMEARLPLTELLSYSGWNTAGNSLGLALAQGVSRSALLSTSCRGVSVEQLTRAAVAQSDYLLHRFVLDDRWKNQIQPAAYAAARAMGADPYNLDSQQAAQLENFVRDRLDPATRDFFQEHFAGKSVVLGSRGAARLSAPVVALDSVEVRLPWPRLFETELEPSTTLGHVTADPLGDRTCRTFS
jgi:Protein of unknown function (DUF4127)